MPPTKKKVVKHLKKNWKKHTDIADIEEYLDDKRSQERTGGIVADKKDDQLFFIDSAPPPVSLTRLTVSRKKLAAERPLRCFANLRQDDGVPVVNTPQVGEKGKKRKRLPLVKRRQTDPRLIKRLRAGQRQHAINERKKEAARREEEGAAVIQRDLWAIEEEEDDDDPLAFHKSITKQTRVAPPNSRDAMKNLASKLPAIPVPHPGASYNPDLKDFVDHLSVANRVEEVKLKAQKKLERELDEKFPGTEEAKGLEANWIKEMSGGLEGGDAPEEPECENLEQREKSTAKKTVKRKTKQQRRKAKEQKSLRQKREKIRSAKQREMEFGRLKSIKKEIGALERERLERMRKKESLSSKRAETTRRLGQTKYEPMDVEVKLSHELVSDLRSLVPEGNLLEDRYDNFKKRNLLAPGVRQKKGQTKYKKKKQEKRAWRSVTLEDIDVPIASV